MRPVPHSEVLPVLKFPEKMMFRDNESGGDDDGGAYASS